MNLDPNQIELYKELIPQSTLELLLNPTAQGIGFSIAGIYYGIFGKLIRYGVVQKAKTDALIKKTAEKYNNIPEDKRTDVNKGLIYKYFEDSRYSLASEELRELFSNLIANSANTNNIDKVSPYYSTVLKNLDQKDAVFLERFKNKQSLAIVKITFTDSKSPSNFTDYKQDYILNKNNNSKKETIKTYSKEIDTLESLGIVKRKYGQINNSEKQDIQKIFQHINDKHLEKKLAGHFTIELDSDKPQEIFLTQHPYDTVRPIPGSLDLTDLGKSFIKMVL
nr:hypothetical protein CJ225_06085 [Gardnerella vaginalis]